VLASLFFRISFGIKLLEAECTCTAISGMNSADHVFTPLVGTALPKLSPGDNISYLYCVAPRADCIL